jgi:hypothetical protein
MKFLVICDHERFVTEAETVDTARTRLTCQKCHRFVLKKGTVEYRNIRVYEASEDDIRLLGGMDHHWRMPEPIKDFSKKRAAR